MTDWTQERRERLERAWNDNKGNIWFKTVADDDLKAALSEIDRLTARVEALEGETARLLSSPKNATRLAEAIAELQSPRPPSESDVEAIARIIDPHALTRLAGPEGADKVLAQFNAETAFRKARAILSHLTQAK